MATHQLNFDHLHKYDPTRPGIDVPLELRTGHNAVKLTAKLDTGAAFCIFQRVYGELLGLDVERGVLQTVGTATGTFETFGHELTLTCFNFEFDVTVYFAKENYFKRNVLGRSGWLDHLRVGLVDYVGELYTIRYE